jgi:N-acetylmuramoyl-L-alanine amidase
MLSPLFAAAALWLALPHTPAPGPGLPLIALDAGHGGLQAGAHGVCGAWEKDITLQIAQRVAHVLTESGRARPLLIRTSDETLDLAARSARAQAAHAAMFISIHANASTSPTARGIETFFLSLQASDRRLRRLTDRENDGQRLPEHAAADPLAMVLRGLSLDAAHVESQALAMHLQRAMVDHLHSRGRGVLQAPFMVLLGARMPAALVEVGFVTHPQECVRLTTASGQEAIAEAVAAGILTHLALGQNLTAQALGQGSGA